MKNKRFSKYISGIPSILIIGTFLLAGTSYSQDNNDPSIYEVKPGDTLTQIALNYGNIAFWVDIYQANQDEIANPNLIYPGQKLHIPSYVVFQKTSSYDFKEIAMKKDAEGKNESIRDESSSEGTENEEMLEKFREAFEQVTDEESKQEQTENSYSGLGLGGMVLDETRSKMGRDFYSIFYNHWENSSKLENYTITISEKPVPSRGTMIQIEIDDELVFQNRLEPRYHKTEEAAKQAVSICQQRLQQQASLQQQNELIGY